MVFKLLAIVSLLWLSGCGFAGRALNHTAVEEKVVGNMHFVRAGGGEFLMGSRNCGGSVIEECPRHRVHVSPFLIGKYEVTQDEYFSIMGTNPSRKAAGGRYPVSNVSWFDAKEFCSRFSRKYSVKARMPTEAEWEYACRAGTETDFYWGDEPDGRYCRYFHNSGAAEGHGGSAPVGTVLPNRLGLFDMSGNLWEWCLDNYDIKYYSISPYRDPKGPEEGPLKVLRGGSWNDGGFYMRSDLRNAGGPAIGDEFRGFRVVLEIE